MGNKPIAPPPEDFRIERVKKTFQLPSEKLVTLWAIFLRYDREKKGRISVEDFLSQIIQYRSNTLTECMMQLIDSSSEGTMTFGEYIEIICTFCCFEQNELLRYVFYILDPQRTGLVKKDELKHMIYKMNYNEKTGSMREAFQYLDDIDESSYGVFNFHQLLMLRNKYPNIFHSLYFFQTQLKKNTLGEFWWDYHLNRMNDEKQERLAVERMKLKNAEKEKEKESAMLNERMIRLRMGPFRYYCMPWLRIKELQRLQRIAAIEQELEEKMDD